MKSSVLPSNLRSHITNPYLLALLGTWLCATIYLLFGADLSLLRYGNQEPVLNTLAQLGVGVFIIVLMVLTKRNHLKPIDHTSDLGITRQAALIETTWLIVYLFVTVGLGIALNIHTHIGFHVVSDGTQTILGFGPAFSSVIWAFYNTVVYVVIPLLYFVGIKKYSSKSLLLGFPKPQVFLPYAIIAGLAGFVPFLTPEYFKTPLSAHLLTFMLYFFGTLLPVAIFTQALLAPRFAIITRSWLSGAVLAGLGYALFNLNEYFLDWSRPEKIVLSLVSLLAGDLMWGFLKAMSTLLLGSAWLHIFTTHTLHFADAPAIAKVFNLR